MLDFSVVYGNASKKEKKILDKIKGNTLDELNMVMQLSSFEFTPSDLEKLSDIVELYESINQKEGFIEVLDKALKKVKRTSSYIIQQVLKESRIK